MKQIRHIQSLAPMLMHRRTSMCCCNWKAQSSVGQHAHRTQRSSRGGGRRLTGWPGGKGSPSRAAGASSASGCTQPRTPHLHTTRRHTTRMTCFGQVCMPGVLITQFRTQPNRTSACEPSVLLFFKTSRGLTRVSTSRVDESIAGVGRCTETARSD